MKISTKISNRHFNAPPFRDGLGMLFFFFTFLLLLSSCSETDDSSAVEYPDWQNTNVTYWNNLYTTTQQKIAGGDTSWKILRNYSLEDSLSTLKPTDYLIVHVLEEGNGSGSPLYTDSVRVRHAGRLLPSTSYPNGYYFDNNAGSVEDNAGVSDMACSGLVFSTALMYMHIGDKWEVYVPWTIGYGESGNETIPGYSVLRFTVQLLAYSRAGSALPDFKAKRR